VEAALAIVTLVAAVVTIIAPDWIEVVFKIDPDEGSGALEVAIVVALAVVTAVAALAARVEWRAARPSMNAS
jgi:hypothetical protein